MGEVDLVKLIENFWRFPNYFISILPKLSLATLWSDLAEWFWGIKRWTGLLLDTLLIAYVGTLIGAFGGFVLCFLASANLVRSRTLVFVTRRYLEFCRTVPDMVFALVFVLVRAERVAFVGTLVLGAAAHGASIQVLNHPWQNQSNTELESQAKIFSSKWQINDFSHCLLCQCFSVFAVLPGQSITGATWAICPRSYSLVPVFLFLNHVW